MKLHKIISGTQRYMGTAAKKKGKKKKKGKIVVV